MLAERKTTKRIKTSLAKRVARRLRTASASRVRRAPIVLAKADNAAVTLAIEKVGAKYAKMLNLLSQ